VPRSLGPGRAVPDAIAQDDELPFAHDPAYVSLTERPNGKGR
jgi:hypothetical protein